MKRLLYIFVAALLFAACGGDDAAGGGKVSPSKEELAPQKPAKANTMNVYAHFMVWFETDKTNIDTGKWGWHWTMNASLNPGSGEIASHYHPLIGAYASGDATILDYQCLLMKYSGIDGVIVDWYGSVADNTVARHTSNTEALFSAINKAGLKFAICYEDQTYANATDPVSSARADMTYLAKNFFNTDSYAKIDGRPLLLDFGPQAITKPKDWFRIFQVLMTKPYFIVLNNASDKANDDDYTNSQGEFLWVNGDPASWYATAKQTNEMVVGGAMPGFNDYYKLGNAGDGYTTYDTEGGALFNRQLEAAREAGLDWMQISTWNDYGEGTIIEPTTEFGYRYLVALQSFTGVDYKQSHLEAIYKWYTLKVKYANDSDKTAILNRCYDYLNALQPEKAVELMETL